MSFAAWYFSVIHMEDCFHPIDAVGQLFPKASEKELSVQRVHHSLHLKSILITFIRCFSMDKSAYQLLSVMAYDSSSYHHPHQLKEEHILSITPGVLPLGVRPEGKLRFLVIIPYIIARHQPKSPNIERGQRTGFAVSKSQYGSFSHFPEIILISSLFFLLIKVITVLYFDD